MATSEDFFRGHGHRSDTTVDSRFAIHVELETLKWVDWFNHERPHESVDDLTPLQAEHVHYAARNRLVRTG